MSRPTIDIIRGKYRKVRVYKYDAKAERQLNMDTGKEENMDWSKMKKS